MTCLTVTECMCNKWPRICSVWRNQNPVLSSFMTCQTVNFPSGDFYLTTRNPSFVSFFVSSGSIARKSRYEPQALKYWINWDIYTPYAGATEMLNQKFSDFVECIYSIELEIKDTTYTARSALGLLHTSHYIWTCTVWAS
jgi:hypothetical protein